MYVYAINEIHILYILVICIFHSTFYINLYKCIYCT